MDLTILTPLLPIGCVAVMHDSGNLEVYRDLQNGDRWSRMFATQGVDSDMSEADIAQAVFAGLQRQKYGDDRTTWPQDVPGYTAGAEIDI